MSAKSVLVTGGAGYLGSVLVRKLCRSTQYDITVADNFTWGFNSILALLHHERLQFLNVDLTEDFDYSPYDLIVNLAAIPGEVLARLQPNRSYQVNYLLPLRIAESLEPDQSIIQISSTAVYGDREGEIIDIDTPIKPSGLGIYAMAKAAVDLELMNNPKVFILRLGTLYGPSPVMRPHMLIHDMVRNAVKHQTEHLYGKTDAIRPLIHVSDAAQIISEIIKSRHSLKWRMKILASENRAKHNIVTKIASVCKAGIFRSDQKDLIVQDHEVKTIRSKLSFMDSLKELKRLFEVIG